ncbi:MAG: hypothetical protein NVSMB68_16630 [Thermoanaerobaculia bacterium]
MRTIRAIHDAVRDDIGDLRTMMVEEKEGIDDPDLVGGKGSTRPQVADVVSKRVVHGANGFHHASIDLMSAASR